MSEHPTTPLPRCSLCGQLAAPGDDMRPVDGGRYVHAHHPRGV